MDPIVIIRRPEVIRRTGISRSHLYFLMNRRRFPASIKLSSRMVGWDQAAVNAWILSRPVSVYK